MASIIHLFQWLSLFFLIISLCASAFNIPRLGIMRRSMERQPQTMSSSQFPEDLETFCYTQRLDHFNYRPDSYTTFQQRYMINFKHWGEAESSAPILYFDGIAPQAGYFYVVTKDFKETSESCYQTIRKSWFEIDRVAKKPNGLSILSKRFKTCKELSKKWDLKDYLDSVYVNIAQYNDPPVKFICDAIDAAATKTDVLGQIFEGFVTFRGHQSCYDLDQYNHPTETDLAWRWQTCSEIVMPIGDDRNDSMFQIESFNMKDFVNDCRSLYGVLPQPHWVTTYYGGQDLKLVLHSERSIQLWREIFITIAGSHCQDLYPEKPSDPQWLVKQRNTEVNIIKGWIDEYHADLIAIGRGSKEHVAAAAPSHVFNFMVSYVLLNCSFYILYLVS